MSEPQKRAFPWRMGERQASGGSLAGGGGEAWFASEANLRKEQKNEL